MFPDGDDVLGQLCPPSANIILLCWATNSLETCKKKHTSTFMKKTKLLKKLSGNPRDAAAQSAVSAGMKGQGRGKVDKLLGEDEHP